MENTDLLEIKAGLQVLKPAADVFDAVVDPAKMKNYFISESTGFMKQGETVTWKFPEFDLEFPVTIGKIEKNKYISFYWDGAMDGEQTLVEISLQERENNATQITVTEKSKANNEAGIKWLKNNTEGWANFLACLKAWIEYGVHLRKGAFTGNALPE